MGWPVWPRRNLLRQQHRHRVDVRGNFRTLAFFVIANCAGAAGHYMLTQQPLGIEPATSRCLDSPVTLALPALIIRRKRSQMSSHSCIMFVALPCANRFGCGAPEASSFANKLSRERGFYFAHGFLGPVSHVDMESMLRTNFQSIRYLLAFEFSPQFVSRRVSPTLGIRKSRYLRGGLSSKCMLNFTRGIGVA